MSPRTPLSDTSTATSASLGDCPSSMLGADGWRAIRFTDEDITADPELTTIVVTTE
jgi:hypothetical protein